MKIIIALLGGLVYWWWVNKKLERIMDRIDAHTNGCFRDWVDYGDGANYEAAKLSEDFLKELIIELYEERGEEQA